MAKIDSELKTAKTSPFEPFVFEQVLCCLATYMDKLANDNLLTSIKPKTTIKQLIGKLLKS